MAEKLMLQKSDTGGKERVSKQALKKRIPKKSSEVQTRSERYNLLSKVIEAEAMTISDAVAKIKATSTTKFDSSVELHIHLRAKKGKKGSEDEFGRGIVTLPHGLGKIRQVVILTEEKISELEKTQKIDFDVAIATPALMSKLGKVAKLLGTKGKMPNPKAGTVTDKTDEVKAAIEAGRVEWRQDAGRNVHQMIGKASWDDAKLIENAQAVLKLFTINRIESVSLASTMGPSVRVIVDKK